MTMAHLAQCRALRQKKVFKSVFETESPPTSTSASTSLGTTANASPDEGSATPHARRHENTSTASHQRQDITPFTRLHQPYFDQFWSLVTSTLSLDKFTQVGKVEDVKVSRGSQHFYYKLQHVVHPQIHEDAVLENRDLAAWLVNHTRTHFLSVVNPWLVEQARSVSGEHLLHAVFDALQWAKRLYLENIGDVVMALSLFGSGRGQALRRRIENDFQSLAQTLLPDAAWDVMKWYLSQSMNVILGKAPGADRSQTSDQESARADLENFISFIRASSLAGERFQIMVAEVMCTSISSYVNGTYARLWNWASVSDNGYLTPTDTAEGLPFGADTLLTATNVWPRVVTHTQASKCVEDICAWTEERYATLASEILALTTTYGVSDEDIQSWKEMGIKRLTDLRASELFDVVVGGPDNHGALEDLRTAVTTAQNRLQLTDSFIEQLKDRLLHQGASTVQILRTYIAMICAFHKIDSSQVLLDRVSFPLQIYLSSREDTGRVIITGLLTSTWDKDGNELAHDGERLAELGEMLYESSDAGNTYDDGVEKAEKGWIPDPVDAGPGYKRSKTVDVIGTMIGVLGTEEVFSKEFQKILGENLLKSQTVFRNENALLQLLKSRFGEENFRYHEIMLKDIHDSRLLDHHIQHKARVAASEPGIPIVHGKMLSHIYWPELEDNNYTLPGVVSDGLQRFEAHYKKMKHARKLEWLPCQGQARVELELEDRTFDEEVTTTQATVIFAFQGGEGVVSHAKAETVVRTIDELKESLQMKGEHLRGALRFWKEKMIVDEIRPGQYIILERLNDEQRAGRSRSHFEEEASDNEEDKVAGNGMMSEADRAKYWQFVQAMLTNTASQMPVAQINMMLKMFGFPYSDQDLVELLDMKVDSGDLEFNAGKYKLSQS